jgi:hypothetical protein
MKKKTKKMVAFDSESDSGEEDVPSEEEKESLNNSLKSIGSKRGRQKIPEMWTRVIDLTNDDLDDLRVYELAPDLLLGNAMKASGRTSKLLTELEPIFWPETYVEDGHSLKVADNQLS